MKRLIIFLVGISLIVSTGYGVSKAQELDSASARGLSLIQNINAGDESNNLELRLAGTDEEWGSEDVFIGQYDLSPSNPSNSNQVELRNTREFDDEGCGDACGGSRAVYKVKLIEQCINDVTCDPNIWSIKIEQIDGTNVEPIIYDGKLKDLIEDSSNLILVDYFGDPNNELEITMYYNPDEVGEGAIIENSFSLMFYEIGV
ncbi:MAG TPA: hypothetical protein PK957_02755 [Candidatus Dojkabacteria bacterium]|nr:hypothetical protein [Candidatus Dojkabacteria bacterium]HQF36582.1 hypothetical protein [Candidatus Dojkabacteria bacterium]